MGAAAQPPQRGRSRRSKRTCAFSMRRSPRCGWAFTTCWRWSPKTPLQSMFGDLRTEVARWSSLKDATPKSVPQPEYVYGSAGKSVAADIWTIGEKGTAPSFEIVRSHEVPFDFVNVVITTNMGITLTASTTEVVSLSEHELASISLPDAAAWDALADAHRKKVAAARLAQPNWRLWSIRTAGRDGRAPVVRARRERGGQHSCCATRRRAAPCFPWPLLDDEEDRRAIQAGRWWHNVERCPVSPRRANRLESAIRENHGHDPQQRRRSPRRGADAQPVRQG